MTKRKTLVLSAVVIVIILVPIAVYILQTPSFIQTTFPKIGVYYYVWCGDGKSGGLGTAHWNDTSNNIVVDTPEIGFYNSNSTDTITTQLNQMNSIGVDFVIVSWWGIGSYEDSVTKLVFSTINSMREANSTFKMQAALIVEPFNQSSGIYNFKAIYDYIYDTFVAPYPDIYMKINNKNLVVFYNEDVNMTPKGVVGNDSRFETRISGHQDYVDWVYWSVGKPYPSDYSTNSDVEQPWINYTHPLCVDGEMSVIPRYDDLFQRDPYFRFDVTYQYNLYDQQWNDAISLAQQGVLKYVIISTWNEYHERTQIEPNMDATSAIPNDPYFLYNKTNYYINQIKSGFFPYTALLVTIAVLAVTIIVATVYFKKLGR